MELIHAGRYGTQPTIEVRPLRARTLVYATADIQSFKQHKHSMFHICSLSSSLSYGSTVLLELNLTSCISTQQLRAGCVYVSCKKTDRCTCYLLELNAASLCLPVREHVHSKTGGAIHIQRTSSTTASRREHIPQPRDTKTDKSDNNETNPLIIQI